MDFTSQTIDKILDLRKPEIIDMFGAKHTTAPIYRNNDPLASPRSCFSLAAVVDYLSQNPDALAECLIEIQSRCVNVVSPLNEDMGRHKYLISTPQLPKLALNQFIDIESFKIMMLSGFVQNEHRDIVINFVSHICQESSGTLEDDGITQKVTQRQGIASLTTEKANVPNPVVLQPYRTFYDIPQPESEFVFRLQDDTRRGVAAGLFEADGGAWIGKEVQAIKDFFTKHDVTEKSDIKICLLG